MGPGLHNGFAVQRVVMSKPATFFLGRRARCSISSYQAIPISIPYSAHLSSGSGRGRLALESG